MDSLSVDLLVIGGGIAGTSVAANLVPDLKVCVIKAEEYAGFHSTGRSVAVYAEAYGSQVIRKLTKKSATLFLEAEAQSSCKILRPRGFLFIAREDQNESINDLARELSEEASLATLGTNEALELVPALRKQYVSRALCDSRAKDIDVAALHNFYIRTLRQGGGQLLLTQRAKSIENKKIIPRKL